MLSRKVGRYHLTIGTCVLVVLPLFTSGAVAVVCPGLEVDCTTPHRIQTIQQFFDHITPHAPGSPITLKDLGSLLSRQVDELKEMVEHRTSNPEEPLSSRTGRQYYATTDTGGYYAATGGYPGGYSVYSGGTSSTSFNGLDAGLSALAFLAFVVWLFNLVLPQLQGAGLGLPGLKRRHAEFSSSGGDQVSQQATQSSPGILSSLLSNSQELVNKIFKPGTSRQAKRLWSEWINQENQATDTNTTVLQNGGKSPGNSTSVLENDSDTVEELGRETLAGMRSEEEVLQ